MLFEAEPPKSIADHIKIDKPDPKQFPDAYASIECQDYLLERAAQILHGSGFLGTMRTAS